MGDVQRTAVLENSNVVTPELDQSARGCWKEITNIEDMPGSLRETGPKPPIVCLTDIFRSAVFAALGRWGSWRKRELGMEVKENQTGRDHWRS